MKKILILTLLAGVAFSQSIITTERGDEVIIYPKIATQAGLDGKASFTGTGTNGQVAVWTGVDSIGASGVTPYDPNVLIAMIGTNSTAIDERYGSDVTIITQGASAQENGTNLVTTINALNVDGTNWTAVVPNGIYDLPSDLIFSNCVGKLIAMNSFPIRGVLSGLTFNSTPLFEPLVTITGNVQFVSSADILGSVLDGIKVVGSVSAPRVSTSDYLTPNLIRNSYITGNVCSNETMSLNISHSFIGGTCAYTSPFDCAINDTTIIGSFSFGVPAASPATRKLVFQNVWVAGTNCFQSNNRAGVPVFNNCIIDGRNFWVSGGSQSEIEAYGTRWLYNGAGTNTWLGFKDIATSIIYNGVGVNTNLATYSSAILRNTYDYLNVDVSN